MSPQSSTMLLEEIAPRLRSVIPRVVMPVGAEDSEELVQDALYTAARMLDSVDRQKKKVTAGNIAYYAILHMKSGRRGNSCGRTDVLAPTTQLDSRSSVLSMEEEVGWDPEMDEPITLGELLASEHEDPAMIAARDIDWDLLASSAIAYGATPEQEKAFVESYQKAFETKDEKTLKSFLSTEGAPADIVEMFTMMTLNGAGGEHEDRMGDAIQSGRGALP